MKKKSLWGVGAAVLIFLFTVSMISAQTTPPTPVPTPAAAGSIRGTVYLDTNGNGICPDAGEKIHVGVPIEFVSDDGKWSTFLQTGDDGTYGLVAAGYGTWKVSARPNANDFVVTSKPTKDVFLSSEEPLALNVNFCIRATSGTTTAARGGTVLPAAGGEANNTPFTMAILSGLAFLGLGLGLTIRKSNA